METADDILRDREDISNNCASYKTSDFIAALQ